MSTTEQQGRTKPSTFTASKPRKDRDNDGDGRDDASTQRPSDMASSSKHKYGQQSSFAPSSPSSSSTTTRTTTISPSSPSSSSATKTTPKAITLFLCGDVMTGRGIDQLLAHPSDPRLYEPCVSDARTYVKLAYAKGGQVKAPVDPSYIWGDALAELEEMQPDVRIINLETAITRSEHPMPKGINYRMSPGNIECIKALAPDCCLLANNHVLDWGVQGLEETLATLRHAGINYAGAGHDVHEAKRPLVCPVPGKGRVLIFAFGHPSSGVPPEWTADRMHSGVNVISSLSRRTVDDISQQIRKVKQPNDVVVVSIHWGGNWGFAVPEDQRAFAHALIDHAAVDVLHGHSSHHIKGIEVYRNHLIIYGCGDLLSDYEGISGHDAYHDELGLMYFPQINPEIGNLLDLTMTPTHLQHLRINRATSGDAQWLAKALNVHGRRFETEALRGKDSRLHLHWHNKEQRQRHTG